MTTPLLRVTAIAALICLLPACSTVPLESRAAADLQATGLAQADLLLKKAARFPEHGDAAAVYRLRAAELAWGELAGRTARVGDIAALPERQQHALRIGARAAEGLAPLFVSPGVKPERAFTFAGRSYRVAAPQYAQLLSVKPADAVPRKLMNHWYATPGAGAPLSPEWRLPDGEKRRFVASGGYIEPLTAVLAFGGPARTGKAREVTLTAYDPTSVSRVRLAGADYPLAADFTAPLVDRTIGIHELWLALRGLFNPDSGDARYTLIEPYDPARIPVVLVHGLNSHPRMWRNVVNDLRADPELRARYQFLTFYYPSGWPIAYSSMRLRDELTAFDAAFGRQHDMVFIGHSMGGLLSRLQVISPGRAIWDEAFGPDADALHARLPADSPVKRALLFEANPGIRREIYICVPHRGSGMADLTFAGLFSRLIRLPGRIVAGIADLPVAVVKGRPLTSIAGLSPGNPLYAAIGKVPIQVPHHSIIGDRGKGNTPDSSDGVVPYRSSHLASAQSELIVPGPHGSYELPQTIDEIRRILRLHAGLARKAPPHARRSPRARG